MESSNHVLSGNSSSFVCDIYPPIEVPFGKRCMVGMIKFLTYNDIPNITENVNNLFYYDYKKYKLETGTYNISDIQAAIHRIVKLKKSELSLTANTVTLKSDIKSIEEIDFTKEKTIGPLLGFDKVVIEKNVLTTSNNIVKIFEVDLISIDLDIAQGAYKNGVQGHSIYQSAITVGPGQKITETPKNIDYFPVSKRKIDRVAISLTDQLGRLINLRGDSVTIEIKFVLFDKINNGYSF